MPLRCWGAAGDQVATSESLLRSCSQLTKERVHILLPTAILTGRDTVHSNM